MTTGRDMAFLRGQLASVGIVLDARPGPSSPIRAATAATATPQVDRELVREILVTAGAPEHHVDWLTNSCPSVEDALTYRAPAWCARCEAPVAVDEHGCIACRARAAEQTEAVPR